MRYRNLGRSGLRVSCLGLGTMNFGTHTEEPVAQAIMSQALDRGVSLFDTADIYGGKLGQGLGEEMIGRWFAQDPSRRDRVVLSTKVYGVMGKDPNAGRLSALHIRRGCEDSLRRLQTDRIDLYQLHHIDRTTPREEIWRALDLLISQGKVLYAGSSNFPGWYLAGCAELARQRGYAGITSEQSVYNLMERTVELEVLPACQEYGIGFLPYSPLQGGLLAGGAQRAPGKKRSDEPRASRQLAHAEQQLAAYERWCEKLAAMPAAVAIAWLLHQPGVTAPIIGPRTPEHLTAALAAVKITLDNAQLRELSTIFPGPGRAPEAYAW
jgi:aryl-alcohol dehydrogenase-like predicted oxidoreductase